MREATTFSRILEMKLRFDTYVDNDLERWLVDIMERYDWSHSFVYVTICVLSCLLGWSGISSSSSSSSLFNDESAPSGPYFGTPTFKLQRY